MLEILQIQNFALIDSLSLEFQKGFTVLTGETGAGKSILLDALGLVLGSRASSEWVRQGEKKARVNAIFKINSLSPRLQRILEDHEIDMDGKELILSRIITADGRSRAYVNGNIVSVSVLSALGDELVDIHGQHAHQSLLKPNRQIEIIDSFAGLTDNVVTLSQKVKHLRDIENQIAELSTHDRERQRQIEFMQFELEEIDSAQLSTAEEEELRSRRNLLANAETIAKLTNEIYTLLYDNNEMAAIDCINQALRATEELSEIDSQFSPLLQQLEEVRLMLENITESVRFSQEEIRFDPQEREQINERLDKITSLKRKYGGTIEEILAYREKIYSDISQFEKRDETLSNLQAQHDKLEKEINVLAKRISSKRKQAAQHLDKSVTQTLQELSMKGAIFQTRFESSPLTYRGIDKIEFMLSANPGEPAKSLRHVASGGELSRVMLALKCVFSQNDFIETLIFDEIDTGVGGAVAGKIAKKLQELSKTHQVFCITHLPQIASKAQSHFVMVKKDVANRTISHAQRVEGKKRTEEIARLLDGSVSPTSLRHAEVLLNNTENIE